MTIEEKKLALRNDRAALVNWLIELEIKEDSDIDIIISELDAWFEAGAKINARNNYGETALHVTLRRKHPLPVLQAILHRKPNLKITNVVDEMPFEVALRYGTLEVIQAFLNQKGFNLEYSDPRTGDTPAMLAITLYAAQCIFNDDGALPGRDAATAVLMAVLEKNPNLRTKNKKGNNLLMHAVENRVPLDVTRVILNRILNSNPDDISVKNNNGQDVFALAQCASGEIMFGRNGQLTQFGFFSPIAFENEAFFAENCIQLRQEAAALAELNKNGFPKEITNITFLYTGLHATDGSAWTQGYLDNKKAKQEKEQAEQKTIQAGAKLKKFG
jgi:hypothetical protein